MQSSLPATPTSDRLEFVDALRGFALFGVFGANLWIFSGFTYMSDAQRAMLPTAHLDGIVSILELVLVENKFLGLFAFLFGVSFWLFLDRARARGVDRTGLFYRRLGWLFVIGSVHGWLFWCFDVLRFYALWGLLLPLFLRVSNKAVLSWGLFFSVLAPALISGLRSLLFGPSGADSAMDALALQAFSSGDYGEVLRVNWIYDWYLTNSVGQIAYQVAIFGRLLLGLYAARALLLTEIEKHRADFRPLLIWGSLVGVGGNIIAAGDFLPSGGGAGFLWAFAKRLIAELGYLGLTLADAAALALLFQIPRWARVLRVLAPVGRMALTCYLLQTLFGQWLFYAFLPGPNLMGEVGPAPLLLVWTAGYALQVWFASAWLRRFLFGPAEWLWRTLTYGRIQAFRKAAPEVG
ncbi:MAG: DUF418 domain-containing protein [Planctomycetes bacterium]|nr:DUF418 domain-containing protein [Planctomycetota bacterium]